MIRRMMNHRRTVCAVLAAVSIAAGLTACGDDRTKKTTRAQPLDPSLFPVVLDRDVRVIAQADGSRIQELPVEKPAPPARTGVSPNGRLTATYRDGKLYIQEPGRDPQEVSGPGLADALSVVLWSPDSTRLAYIVPSAHTQQGQVYVVGADGKGSTLVGDTALPPGEGADSPTWSPDSSRIATWASGFDAVRVLSASGGPPVDLAGSAGHFSWSPDARFLAFDPFEGGADPSALGVYRITIADMTAAGSTRTLADGRWPRWSPTGDRIAFKGGRSPSRAYTIRPDGSGLADLGVMGNEIYNDFTWSEDGRQVEFVRGGPNFPVYAIDVRTAAVTRHDPGYDVEWSGLRPLSGRAPEIRVSPDGGRIAFAGYELGADRRSGWLILDVASGTVSQLSDEIGSHGGDVHWSAGGVRVAYPAGELGVFITDSGGRARCVSALVASEMAWSPDGERLAIATGSEIAIAAVEGTEHSSIATDDGTPGGLAWSPDGKRLLYEVRSADDDDAGPSQIFAVEVDGAQVTPVTDTAETAFGASWSPDGRTIAYDRVDGGHAEVWLADENGGNARRLAGDGGGQLEWSPDGTRIAAVAGLHVNVIDVATGAIVRVAEAGGTSAQAGYCPAAVVVHWSQDSQVVDVAVACHSPQI